MRVARAAVSLRLFPIATDEPPSLAALPKKDGSVRPIAVGEYFRRLTAKCLCATCKDQASEFFWPLQQELLMALNAELAVHRSHLAVYLYIVCA